MADAPGAVFTSLHGPQRDMLALLAVSESSPPFGRLVSAAWRLPVQDAKRMLTEAMARRWIRDLVDRGLVHSVTRSWQYSGLQVATEVKEPLVRWLIHAGQYLRYTDAWEERYAHAYDDRTLVRRLRRSIVAGDVYRFDELHDRCVAPFDEWLTEPLEERLIEERDPRIQGVLLSALIRLAFEADRPVPGLFDMVDRCWERTSHPALAQARVRTCLHRGDLSGARQAAEDLEWEGEDQALWAWLRLVEGDVKGATVDYSKALAAAREQWRGPRQVTWLDADAGVWLPLTYLVRDLKSRRTQAKRLMDTWLSEVGAGSPYAGLVHVERLLDPTEPVPRIRCTHPAAVLMEAVVGRWLGTEVSGARLQAARARSAQHGWTWLAAELAAVDQGAPSALPGCVALHSHRQSTSAWEVGLDLLEAALSGEADTRAKRIAWTLSPAPFNLTAREQTRGKRGWSKGRVVASSRLANIEDPLPSISEADRALVRQLRHPSPKEWYEDPDAPWDEDGAWRALCGHPAVFDDEGLPVAVRRVSPRLVVAENRRSIVLTLDPPLGESLVVRSVDPGTYEVFDLDEHQQRLAKVLGKRGMRVPSQEGRERVAGVLARLSEHFEVHDETRAALGRGQAEEVEGSPVPVLQLRPEGEGFVVRLVARPLGTDGPEVEPGQGALAIISRHEGRAVVARRDLDRERELSEAVLQATSLQSAHWTGDAWWLPSPEEALELLEAVHDLGDGVAVEWPEGAELRLRAKAGFSRLFFSVRSADDWLAASGRLEVDEGLVLSLAELLAAVEGSDSRFIRLDDGSILALGAKLRRHLDRLSRAGTREGDTVRVHRLAGGLIQPLLEDAGRRRTDKATRAHLQAALAPATSVAVPADLRAELRPYQVDGFQWLCRLAALGAGACLADDMGLGKTVQALALLLHRAGDGPALVVAPTSVCAGWQQEAWRFAPSLGVRSLHDGDRSAILEEPGPGDVIIASYGLLLSESEALTRVAWSTVILDEAQAIKNTSTQRYKAALALSARFRLALSGTPVENHLGELWALSSFLNPGLLGRMSQFRRRFAAPVEGGDREVGQQLRALVRPLVLRRTKSAVLQDLPPRTEITLEVQLGPEEAAHYEATRRRALEVIEQQHPPSPMAVLAQLTRLRLAACHPRLADSPLVGSAKLKAFGRIVHDLRDGGHRALVFSQFVKHLDILREWLDEAQIPYQYLDGSTPARERARRVEAFQGGEGQVFLISLKAGGLGLNLTAADYVVHMDPWWNPAVEDQASDRAHRIGQTRPVTVYRLVAKGTVEERIVALHQTKRDLADQLLEGADTAARLSAEELVELLLAGR